MIKISKISVANHQNFDIQTGDQLISINKIPISDPFDYQYAIIEPQLRYKFKKKDGTTKTYIFDHLDDLKIEFEDFKIKRCKNRCLFCFIDQMPKGFRKSLYIKDEDYRMSFLYGNFITATSLSPQDLKKISLMKLSPLYLSVHTTNPQLRAKMLTNPQAANIIDLIQNFAEAEIEMHCQAVICPGINDGNELEKTINTLSEFYPYVKTLGIVPVGLTNFRKNLFPLRLNTPPECKKILKIIERYQVINLKKNKTRFVFPADEFFLQAGEKIPCPEYYEGFEQYENGIGMLAHWIDQFKNIYSLLNQFIINKKTKIGFISGISPSDYLNDAIIEPLNKINNLSAVIITVPNSVFGPQVTVTGLLTSKCILKSLTDQHFDAVFIPENCINSNDCFLDGVRFNDFLKKISIKFYILKSDFKNLLFFFKTCKNIQKRI